MLDLKFPTVFAHLSKKKKDEIRACLQVGDILLEDNSSYLLSQFAARITGSSWSHSGFYIGDGKVVDCGSKPYVAQVELRDFLDTSDVAIYRPKYETQEDLEAAVRFTRSCINSPFNRTFNLASEKSLYCTQLIYRALKQMPRPIELPVSSVYKKSVILASSIEKSPKIDLIWISRNGFLKGCLVQMPSIFAVVLGSCLGALICPPYSSVGAVLGLFAIITAENSFCCDKHKKKSMNESLFGRPGGQHAARRQEKLS